MIKTIQDDTYTFYDKGTKELLIALNNVNVFISVNRNTIDVTSMGDEYRTYTPGLQPARITFNVVDCGVMVFDTLFYVGRKFLIAVGVNFPNKVEEVIFKLKYGTNNIPKKSEFECVLVSINKGVKGQNIIDMTFEITGNFIVFD